MAGNDKQTAVRMPIPLYRKIVRATKDKGWSVGWFMRQAAIDLLAQLEKEKAK